MSTGEPPGKRCAPRRSGHFAECRHHLASPQVNEFDSPVLPPFPCPRFPSEVDGMGAFATMRSAGFSTWDFHTFSCPGRVMAGPRGRGGARSGPCECRGRLPCAVTGLSAGRGRVPRRRRRGPANGTCCATRSAAGAPSQGHEIPLPLPRDAVRAHAPVRGGHDQVVRFRGPALELGPPFPLPRGEHLGEHRMDRKPLLDLSLGRPLDLKARVVVAATSRPSSALNSGSQSRQRRMDASAVLIPVRNSSAYRLLPSSNFS